MDLLTKLTELVGYDIFFLGFVTLLSVSVAAVVWSTPFSEDFATRCRTRLGEWLKNDGKLVAGSVVMAAALLGMVVNVTADELLDSNCVVRILSFSHWGAEDSLKEEAAEGALNLLMTSTNEQVIRNHVELKREKALFQHANAAILRSGADSLKTMLRFEYLVVRTLRVLWLNGLVLSLVALAGGLWHRFEVPMKKGGTGQASGPSQAGLWFLTILGLILASYLFLWLWQEQSKRYYRKLLHGYIATELNGDRVIKKSREVPGYTDLKDVPGKKAYGAFSDKAQADGTTDMFEFSAAESVQGRWIVADNETDRLQDPLNSKRDPRELALFEVKENSSKIVLSRVWVGAFEGLGKKDYDDIEGLAFRLNYLYLIGSHSRSQAGKEKPERHVLLRLELDTRGEPVGKPAIFKGLTQPLVRQLEKLQLAPTGRSGEEVTGVLNIEGLAIMPGSRDLLLGLRSPLRQRLDNDGHHRLHAIVLRLHDVDDLFAPTPAEPRISEYAELDLGGKGISSLHFDPKQQAFLVAASPFQEDSVNFTSSLFLWRAPYPSGDQLTEVMRFPGHKLEGVARLDGDQPLSGNLLLAFDEEELAEEKGKEVRHQFGRILILDWNPPQSGHTAAAD